jgi:hypothetical protein
MFSEIDQAAFLKLYTNSAVDVAEIKFRISTYLGPVIAMS